MAIKLNEINYKNIHNKTNKKTKKKLKQNSSLKPLLLVMKKKKTVK